MAVFGYMPLYVGDYLGDTQHLSTVEHGAYMLLLMAYWSQGHALPNNNRKLARIARLSDDEWQGVKDTILELFEAKGETLTHKRVELELEGLRRRIEQAKAAGEASGRARKTTPPKPPTGGGRPERPSNARSTPVERPLSAGSTDVERPLSFGPTDVEPNKSKSKSKNKNKNLDCCAATRASARENGNGLASSVKEELDAIEHEARTAAGLGNSTWPKLFDLSPLLGLIQAGADLHREILPALRAKPNPQARSWDYFVPQIRQFRANLQAASLEPPIPFPRDRARAGPRERRNPWIEANEQILQEQREQTDGDFNGTTIDAVVEPGSESDCEPARSLVARGG
jgi:uncharacterized protein YdaU (DUF1376 family)